MKEKETTLPIGYPVHLSGIGSGNGNGNGNNNGNCNGNLFIGRHPVLGEKYSIEPVAEKQAKTDEKPVYRAEKNEKREEKVPEAPKYSDIDKDGRIETLRIYPIPIIPEYKDELDWYNPSEMMEVFGKYMEWLESQEEEKYQKHEVYDLFEDEPEKDPVIIMGQNVPVMDLAEKKA